MKALTDLPPRTCKYAMTTGGDAPDMTWQRPNFRHLFCGDPTKDEKSPYCAEHHALCYGGTGKDWRSLERMMKGTEQTVLYTRVRETKDDGRREGRGVYEGQFGVDALVKSSLARASRRRR